MPITLWQRTIAGINAFRESFFRSDAIASSDDFESYAARLLRYSVYWAFYENTAYRSLMHGWSTNMKSVYGLYKHVRNIYNPAARLSSFWQTHLMGGLLDIEAGDGQSIPSALPIETDNESLRPAVAQLWRDSGWQTKKSVYTLFGPTLGDVVLRVVDDPDRQKVYLEVTHPGKIEDLIVDPFGNVKGYTLVDYKPDPRPEVTSKTKVKYTEKVWREPGTDDVFFSTSLNDRPYAWNGIAETWTEPYGFVPMIFVQHDNIGLGFGISEMHKGLPKFREVDDLASKTSDQIRKMVNSPWLFSGVQKSSKGVGKPQTTGTDPDGSPTPTDPETGRQEIPIFYGPAGATATPLVANLDLAATLEHIRSITAEIERDYPELQDDIWNASEATSGRALRTARQRSESKVSERRPAYDDGLVRAHQMAIAIGGFRQYDGYEGFDLTSFESGNLDHRIGKRPVFQSDPLDELEIDKAFWEAANSAKAFGIPPIVYLEREGWSEDDLAKITDSPEYQARLQMLENVSQPSSADTASQVEEARQRAKRPAQSSSDRSSQEE